MPLRDLTPWNWFHRTSPSTDITSQPSSLSPYPLINLQRELDRIMDSFFQGFNTPSLYNGPAGISTMSTPRINIAETNDAYHISAELPGVAEHDVDISLSQGILTIKGERKDGQEEKDTNYHRIESSYGAFQRAVSLPNDADQDNVNASFRNGVLNISVGKKAEAISEAKKIPINNEAA